jgi:Protein of unknown function (DUF2628)
VRTFTTHLRQGAVPVLICEGFSIGAALLGWLWLLWHRAWIPAALVFALQLVLARLATPSSAGAILLGLIVLQGLLGRDMVRWSMARRGYADGPVVAARDQDAALARLLTERSELLNNLAGSHA